MNTSTTILYEQGISGPILWSVLMVVLIIGWTIFIMRDANHPDADHRITVSTLSLIFAGFALYVILSIWL